MHTMLTKITSVFASFCIAIISGMLKPCLPAFGGDQFESKRTSQQQLKFFSVFYFSFKSGCVLATFALPPLQSSFKSSGGIVFYPYIFGILVVVLLTSLLFFVSAKLLYKIRSAKTAEFVSIFKCIGHACAKMKSTKGEVKDHWLDYADDKYDKEIIFDAKSLLFVMWVFIPLPVFWAFYAMYSRWEQQARSMKNVGDELLYIPRQLETENLIFPILMVPLFEYIIYPLFSKLDLLETRLQRMAAGGMLSAIAFTLSGIVYLKMEAQPLPYGITITENTIFRQVMLINNSPCSVNVYKPNRHSVRDFHVDFFKVPIGENKRWKIEPRHCSANKTVSVSVDTGVATAELVLLLVTLSDDELIAQVDNEKINTRDKRIRIKICFSTDYDFANHKNASFLLQGDSYYTHISPSNATEPSKYGVTTFKLIKPGKYDLYLPRNESKYEGKPIGSIELEKKKRNQVENRNHFVAKVLPQYIDWL
ncbi:hypothetical protein CEXT_194411 [Caerostris extrusa]|uniref:Uncharacterized protein n=1 Tax=Caerostris extrusa TaxID=172846 RepID=A0AAV4MKY6_CAEEX|nr:hypothetical protein CEXT_194411 [Caerostris extrusa]